MGLIDQPMLFDPTKRALSGRKISRLGPVLGILWAGRDQGLFMAHVVRTLPACHLSYRQSPGIVQWSMALDKGGEPHLLIVSSLPGCQAVCASLMDSSISIGTRWVSIRDG